MLAYEFERRRLTTFRAVLTTAILMMASATSIAAEDQDDDAGSRCLCGLGLGVATEHKPYKGVGETTDPIPLVSYENRWVKLFGPNLDLKVTPPYPLTVSLRLNYEFDGGYKASDSSFLEGMSDRKAGFWVGPAVKWHSELIDLSASYLFDASNKSKGRRASFAAEHPFRFGKFELVPIVSVTQWDRKYVDYYFGVRPTEATIRRPTFIGKTSINPDLSLRASYLFSGKHLVFVQTGATEFGSEVKDSPIVGRSTEVRVWAGYMYRF